MPTSEKIEVFEDEDVVVILDFGSQYTQIIARRLRELNVRSLIVLGTMPIAEIMGLGNVVGIVLSGGPNSTETLELVPDSEIYDAEVPILGICYGMQLLADHFGGRIRLSTEGEGEFGRAKLRILCDDSKLLGGLTALEQSQTNSSGELPIWASHGEQVLVKPKGFSVTASTKTCPISAFELPERQIYGVQFHPEVEHSPCGKEILRRFAIDICGATGDWNAANTIDLRVKDIQQQVGSKEQVLLGLSGGVDSCVAAALIGRAIGSRLTCVLVDNGLMRQNEAEQVMKAMGELGINVVLVDAADLFLRHLLNISDPERKRKVIGNTFVELFEREANKLDNVKWLAQGTIYPDVIESASRVKDAAQIIKSHHNVGGLPDAMTLKLLEPLRDLFKDEVRKLGLGLGLPEDIVMRHPFPGPGLAVRCIGEVTLERLEILRKADAIFMRALQEAGLMGKVSQAFAVFIPVNTVGVVGDRRRHAPVIGLRAVRTNDFMTAHAVNLPWELLQDVAHEIVNSIAGISRVVYDVTDKPPGTIEWE